MYVLPAEKSDAQEFFRLEAECFGMKKDSDAIYFWVPILQHQYCYKAVEDNTIRGGIISMNTKKNNIWYINSLFVKEEYRRKGIAEKLLQTVFEISQPADIIVDINPAQKHLAGFYKKYGFEPRGTSVNHYRDGEDRVLLYREYQG